MKCPDCNRTLKLGKFGERWMRVCVRWPECTYSAHVDRRQQPRGRALQRPRLAARYRAHRYFDRLWASGMMERPDAYTWLAHELDLPEGLAHIRYLDEAQCEQVVTVVQEFLHAHTPVNPEEQRKQERKALASLRNSTVQELHTCMNSRALTRFALRAWISAVLGRDCNDGRPLTSLHLSAEECSQILELLPSFNPDWEERLHWEAEGNGPWLESRGGRLPESTERYPEEAVFPLAARVHLESTTKGKIAHGFVVDHDGRVIEIHSAPVTTFEEEQELRSQVHALSYQLEEALRHAEEESYA